MARFLQVILGLLFLASGLAKGLSPFFSVAKLDEYLMIAGLNWFVAYDMELLILLNATEVTLGVMLIFNIRPKLALWVATLMMVVFTPKTMYVAAKGLMPLSGCFGRFLPMTPWQSHWKNIFMDILLVILWFKRKDLYRTQQKSSDWFVIAGTGLAMIVLQVIVISILF